MSEQEKTMTQRLTDVVTAADSLTQTVQNQIGQINSTVSAKMGEVESTVTSTINKLEEKSSALSNDIAGFIDSRFRTELPFFRATRNQELKINGSLTPGTKGIPDGFGCRNTAHYECEIVAYSQHGTEAEDKDPEIQAMYRDIKGGVPKYNQPDFAIVRVKALEVDDYPDFSNAYSIYQGGLPQNVPFTHGGWIKAEQGRVRFTYPLDQYEVPVDGKWHEVTRHENMPNGGANYNFGPHIYLEKGASCLIALPGVTFGKVPKGKWGYFEKPQFER
ncbi:hypothetical protein [Pseudoalteromonas sp. T1lg23B]|uniref:hypothetical protein n=1 Tax=Pseudoalteromonas sp. T1lg23B TaxID=2077097 RepID=UPI000CF6BA27|nr:hypothetical protein [Pseudoalteromonas sp. T1lg23B]